VGAVEPRRDPPRDPPLARRGHASGPRHRPEHPGPAGGGRRPRPRPRGDDAHARAPRIRLRLSGRGTRPARGDRHPRRGQAGPDLVPHERRALRPRRLPRAAAVDEFGSLARLQRDRGVVAAAARFVGVVCARSAGGRRRIHSRALPLTARAAQAARPRNRIPVVAAIRGGRPRPAQRRRDRHRERVSRARCAAVRDRAGLIRAAHRRPCPNLRRCVRALDERMAP
jgi:hypothetical protein